MMPRRIQIVDDHPIVRYGLARLIEETQDLTVCGEAGNIEEALDRVKQEHPDLVLLEVMLAHQGGFELIEKLHALQPEVPVLVVSMFDDPGSLRRALDLGARGYISKKETIQQLVPAIRSVLSGKVYVDERMLDRLSRTELEPGNGIEPDPSRLLSERELEIFRLIGKGFRPQQLAEDLHLSIYTVNVHRQNIRRKLGLQTARDLDRYAVQWAYRLVKSD